VHRQPTQFRCFYVSRIATLAPHALPFANAPAVNVHTAVLLRKTEREMEWSSRNQNRKLMLQLRRISVWFVGSKYSISYSQHGRWLCNRSGLVEEESIERLPELPTPEALFRHVRAPWQTHLGLPTNLFMEQSTILDRKSSQSQLDAATGVAQQLLFGLQLSP
jgi:hypothetical protein